MQKLQIIDNYCQLSQMSLVFKREVSKEEWQIVFDTLNRIEGCVKFWIGDCLKYREQKWGMYDEIAEESGLDKNTLRRYKETAEKIESGIRIPNLTFSHHKQVVSLSPEKQRKLLNKASEENLSVRELRDEVRKEKHSTKEVELPEGKFNVIYADPPWKYDHSRTVVRDIENQYPTMDLDDICELKVPSADNAVLFLWATAPKLQEALAVMNSWGFTYKTQAIWDKEWIGMGYWFRGQHEILLVGTKGGFSPPLTRTDSSVYRERRGKHSKKPDYYYDLIERYFPNGKYLELFARSQYNEKWTVYGNE